MSKQSSLIRFDWAIKHFLRDKANFDILEGFLSAILKQKVQVIQILESEADRETEQLKYNRVDILIQDSTGRYVIIEVQNQHESDYIYRLLFGASKIIIDMLKLGQPYKEIAKVISISILYFNLGSGDDYVYYGSTKFVGLHTHEPLRLHQREAVQEAAGERNELEKKVKYCFRELDIEREIYPEYYLIQVERFSDEIKTDLDEWVYMLKHDEIPADFKSYQIDKAKEKLTVMKMSEAERQRYERYLMNLASERDIMETARQEGLDEGITKGRAEGLVEGVTKGRAEGQRQTARKMLAKGYSITDVAELTGLSFDELTHLEI